MLDYYQKITNDFQNILMEIKRKIGGLTGRERKNGLKNLFGLNSKLIENDKFASIAFMEIKKNYDFADISSITARVLSVNSG